MPSLSVLCTTSLPVELVAQALTPFRQVADQILIATQGAEQAEAYAEVADQVLVGGCDQLVACSRGDWLLILPEAAQPSPHFLQAVPGLLRDSRGFDEVLFPQRFLASQEEVLTGDPWDAWPEVVLVRYSAQLSVDAGGYIDGSGIRLCSSAPLYRLENSLLDLSARQELVAESERYWHSILSPGGHRLYPATFLPSEEAPRRSLLEAGATGDLPTPAGLSSEAAIAPELALELVEASKLWMAGGVGHWIRFRVTNRSSLPVEHGADAPQLHLIWQRQGQTVSDEAFDLPCGLDAGQSTEITLHLDAPAEPGRATICIEPPSGTALRLDLDLSDSITTRLQLCGAGQDLLPAEKVLALRRMADRSNALWEDRLSVIQRPSLPVDPMMAYLLRDMLVGDGSIDGESLDRLQALITKGEPQFMVEFGSGSSTIFLAYLLSQIFPGQRLRLVSFEQDADWAASGTQRLQEMGLDRIAQIIYAPLGEDGFYRFPELALEQVALMKPQLCLIDGPAFHAGITRYGVWEVMRDRLPSGATLLLDDAFRDAELSILDRWLQDGDLEVEGIWPTSKGVIQARRR